eukprot:COSAG05_NODE_2271_length_3302_cov_5923.304090_6_plen_253_part_00
MSWDDDFGGGGASGTNSAFDDEDESSEEEWDTPKKQPAAAKPKSKLEIAIEAREAREAALRSRAGVVDEDDAPDDEDAAARKARIEAAQAASDRAAAMDAFGTDGNVADGAAATADEPDAFEPMNPQASLDGMLPDTAEEFDIFLEKLLGRMRVGGDSVEVMDFIKSVVTRTCTHLKDFELKPIVAALSGIHAEKLAAQREADGKKSKPKENNKVKLGKNSTLNKKKQHKSGTDGDIRYDKYDSYDDIMDGY